MFVLNKAKVSNNLRPLNLHLHAVQILFVICSQSEKSCPKGAKGAKTVCDIQLVNLDVSPTVQAQD